MKAWKNIPQITIWFLLWTMLLLNACVQDELCIEEENTDEHTELVIRIMLPNISYSNSSRALDDAKESNVEDITVLLFASDGSLVTKTDARNITEESTGNEVKFSVRVPTGNFDIMIMANCQSLLSGFTPSAPTKTAYRELLLTASGKWNVGNTYTPIPMWGESRNVTITPNATLTGTNAIRLVRVVSRIELSVDRTTVTNSFDLKSMKMYHWSSSSRIIPDDNVWNPSTSKASDVSSGTQTTTAQQAQEYTDFDQSGSLTKTIYIPETPVGVDGALTGNPCLLVQADWEGILGWYKIEFRDSSNTLLPLIRNHKYQVVITEVTGQGYEVEAEAYASKPTNIKTEILYHDDGELTNVMYDGEYYLAWDPDEFEFTREERTDVDTDNKLTIETNCENGWTMGTIRYITTGQTGWITPSATSGTKLSKTSLSLTITPYTGTTSRIAEIPINAETMNAVIRVIQTSAPKIGIRILDANGNEVSGIQWIKSPEKMIAEREYTVEWYPADFPCTVTATRTGANDLLFDSEYGITTGTITDDNGKKLYHLKFSELDVERDYLQNNNNLRTYGNQYTFTVSYHGTTESASINLRHHLEMIHSDIDTLGYRMGFEYDHNFFASTSYRVTSISDPNSVQFSNEISNANVTVPDGQTNSHNYKFRIRNPNKSKDESKVAINLTFPNSELPDTTLYIQAYYILSNSYMVEPGETVYIPVKQVLRNYRDKWLNDSHLPNLKGMSAHLVWETENGLITSVKMTPTTPINPDPMFAEIEVQTRSGIDGNALVSLEVNDTIVWSWHIWVTDYIPGVNGSNAGGAGSSPGLLFKESPGYGSYYIMDRNLGALSYQLTNTPSERVRLAGMYYQYGRKDPFPPSRYAPQNGNTTQRSSPYNDPTYGMVPLYNVRRPFDTYTHHKGQPSTNLANLRRSIHNPTTFILAPDDYWDWMQDYNDFGEYNNRWLTLTPDYPMVYHKTIWDPCPDGYNGYEYLYIPAQSFHNNGLINYGVTTAHGIYFPAVGYIDNVNFNYVNVGFEMLTVGKTFAWDSQGLNHMGGNCFRELQDIVGIPSQLYQAGTKIIEMAKGIQYRCQRETPYYNIYD